MEIDAASDSESIVSDSAITNTSAASGTPAPSIYSYDSQRDGNALLRQIHGRVFNAQNDLYMLPADEGEHSRLDKQHLIQLVTVGGLYVPKEEVQAALAPEPGITKRILDLGVGGGNWSIGMAQEFPHVQVVGVDLAPSTTRPPPPNCRFEFDDFTLGLPHYYNTFDVVHARSTANGVKDFEWYIAEAARCLKPGGILLITESNLELDNEFKQPQEIAVGEGRSGQSWLARVFFEAHNLMKRRGSSMEAGARLHEYVSRCEELETVDGRDFWVPIGPWERGSTEEETNQKLMVGTLNRQNLIAFIEGLRPLFVTEGFAPSTFDKWVAGSIKELNDLTVHLYVKWHYAWGRRKWIPDLQPRPLGDDVWIPGPSRGSSTEDESSMLGSDRDMELDSVSSWSSMADYQDPRSTVPKESISVRLRR